MLILKIPWGTEILSNVHIASIKPHPSLVLRFFIHKDFFGRVANPICSCFEIKVFTYKTKKNQVSQLSTLLSRHGTFELYFLLYIKILPIKGVLGRIQEISGVLFAITTRSTQTQNGSTCLGLIYGSSKSVKNIRNFITWKRTFSDNYKKSNYERVMKTMPSALGIKWA